MLNFCNNYVAFVGQFHFAQVFATASIEYPNTKRQQPLACMCWVECVSVRLWCRQLYTFQVPTLCGDANMRRAKCDRKRRAENYMRAENEFCVAYLLYKMYVRITGGHCNILHVPLQMQHKYDLNNSRFRVVIVSFLQSWLWFRVFIRFFSSLFLSIFSLHKLGYVCERRVCISFLQFVFDDLFHSLGSVLALY